MTIFGVTPQGFNIKRLIDAKNSLEDNFIGEFGDINLDAQSVTGQIIGIFSKIIADEWENSEEVYESQYPNSASGVSLDNVVQLNGIVRLAAQRTTVIGVATGQENTFIPSGSLARTPINGQVYFSSANAFITSGNAVQNIVEVVTPGVAQEYRVVLSGVNYLNSLPTINFSGPIVSGNTISVRINGINMPVITYAASSNSTLLALASAIVTNSAGAVATATVSGNNINLVPALGFSITVNSVGLSGSGAPTYSLTFRIPATNLVAQFLAAVITSGGNYSATYVSGNTFTITALDSEFSYALSVGENLQIDQVWSPIPFTSQTYGPIPAPVGSLTEILTPIAGWAALTNFKAGNTGRFIETDAELRLRRNLSLKIAGNATVEAIRSKLLQNVPGVTSVTIFENVTMTQEPIKITFSTDFVSGNTIAVMVDGNSLGTVNFTTDNLTTVTLIALMLKTYTEIENAIVSGSGNHIITVTMAQAQEIEIVLTIGGTGSFPNYTLEGGRPPKSYEAVVEGGTDQAVGDQIWLTKPAGILTFGNTPVDVTDSQGNTQVVNFTRATSVYLWATIVLVLNPQETFPINGQQLISDNIVAYGNTLGIGVDVFIQRVQSIVFLVPGVGSATVQLAKTANPTDTPTYSSTDILIGDTEASSWDISRIIVGF